MPIDGFLKNSFLVSPAKQRKRKRMHTACLLALDELGFMHVPKRSTIASIQRRSRLVARYNPEFPVLVRNLKKALQQVSWCLEDLESEIHKHREKHHTRLARPSRNNPREIDLPSTHHNQELGA